jgi:hypothetical protein
VTNIQRLNNVDHAALTVAAGYAAAYGDGVNQCLVYPTEFEQVQREYVILLQKTEQHDFQAVALLGLDKDENLYLTDGQWNARYVPAMHQRGPFMIGFQDIMLDGETHRDAVIHIDLDHPRVQASDGVPVFLQHGGNSPYLEQTIGTLQRIHQGADVSRAMFAAFNNLGLMQTATIEIQLSETEIYELADYYTIDGNRLSQLTADELFQLHQTGYLAAAHFILASLGNAEYLIAQKNRKRDNV